MTSAPAVDERLHAEVLAALLAPVLNGHLYDYGMAPGFDDNKGAQPNIFAVMAVERRYVGARYAGGHSARSGWRVMVRCVGRTVNEARWAINRVTTALEEVVIEVGGVESTPIQHETSSSIRPDDGRQSGLVEFIYAL